MYAEINVSLKFGVKPANLSMFLANHFGNSQIPAIDALRNKPIAGYVDQAVGAASFPSGVVVVYLCTASDEVSVYVYGKTIPQLKDHCAKAVNVMRKISGINVAVASASVLIPVNGTDIDILTGEEVSRASPFLAALLDKSFSKLVAAGINCGLVFWYLDAVGVSALIGFAATAVGVLCEAAHSAWRADSWRWRESQ